MKVSEFRALLESASAGLDIAARGEILAFASLLSLHGDVDLAELGLKKVSPSKSKHSGKESGATLTRKRGAAPAMIREYLTRLRAALQSDDNFEAVVRDLDSDRAVTKGDVEKLYNEVFQSSRQFPDKRTKAQRLEEIRRERLSRIRVNAA